MATTQTGGDQGFSSKDSSDKRRKFGELERALGEQIDEMTINKTPEARILEAVNNIHEAYKSIAAFAVEIGMLPNAQGFDTSISYFKSAKEERLTASRKIRLYSNAIEVLNNTIDTYQNR